MPSLRTRCWLQFINLLVPKWNLSFCSKQCLGCLKYKHPQNCPWSLCKNIQLFFLFVLFKGGKSHDNQGLLRFLHPDTYPTHRRCYLQVKALFRNRKLCFQSFRNGKLSNSLIGKLKRSRFLPVLIARGVACQGCYNNEEIGLRGRRT